MENKFGVKDFIFLSLLILLGIFVWLGLASQDRHLKTLYSVQQTTEEQSKMTGSLDRKLAENSEKLLQKIQEGNEQQRKLLESIDKRLASGVTTNTTPGVINQNTGLILPGAGGSSRSQTHSPQTLTKVIPENTAKENSADARTFAEMLEIEKKADFSRGDWLIDNIPSKVKTLSPIVYDDIYANWVHSRIVEGLLYRDPNTMEFVPQLAKSWSVSPDGLTITFNLREGVRFSDGEPLTADDVVYSFELPMNPKIDCPRLRSSLDKIDSVSKKSDFEVVIKLKEAYFESLDLCGTTSIIPKHFFSKYSVNDVNTKPGLVMGTGPYRVSVGPERWTPGQQIELVRNQNYWGPAGTFDKVIFREIEEETAQETMFKNRELDVYVTQPVQYNRLLKDTKLTERANNFAFESPMNGYFYIAWNQSRNGTPTRFADKRVRKAMTMLCDRQGICDEIFLGYARPISGPFSSGSPQENPNIKSLDFDPEAAKKILLECGYKENSKGQLVDSGGKPFSFRLSYSSSNATFDRVVKYMKDSYAQAGVELIPDPTDWPIMQEKLRTRDYDVISLGWGGSVESDWYQMFDSSQIKDRADNFMNYNNPQLDKILREARMTVDEKARMALWHKAHAILHEDQPYTFLLSRQSLRFIDKRIQNVHKSKLGLNYIYLYNMPMPWYVPKTMQVYTR